jgi:hypothetical protein
MQAGPAAPQPLMRLAGQLHSLSELTETLAFRLLELEERLAAHDLRLQELLQAQGGEMAEAGSDTELRLEDTEERLARLESLLGGLAGSATGHPTPAPALGDPFPVDDGEQPFMDELESPDYLERLSA